MAIYPVDLVSSHKEESNGSHTVIVTISGLPSLAKANEVSAWMRDAIRANAHKIGMLQTSAPRSPPGDAEYLATGFDADGRAEG